MDATRIRAARVGLPTVRTMPNAGWPALLAALSFPLTANLSDLLFGDVARDAFLTVRPKAALPPRLVATLDEPP